MFSWNYRRRRGDRRWRRLRVREAAARSKTGRSAGRLRSALVALLCLELVVGVRQLWAAQGADIRFFRRESACCVEWVEPGAGEGEQEQEPEPEVYGIRIRPDSLELQFYHRSREILPPE